MRAEEVWNYGQEQTCKACGRQDKFNFDVPDELWARVVPDHLRNRVVCLSCFDRFAAEQDIDYASQLRELCFVGWRESMLLDIKSVAGPD